MLSSRTTGKMAFSRGSCIQPRNSIRTAQKTTVTSLIARIMQLLMATSKKSGKIEQIQRLREPLPVWPWGTEPLID